MKQRLQIFLKYYLFWLLFFQLQKVVFMLVQHEHLGHFSLMDMLAVCVHAFVLDLSLASYFALAFALVMIVSVWVKPSIVRWISDALTAVLLLVTLFVAMGDNCSFPAWGYHWDKSVFVFFASPAEVMANAQWWMWLLGAVGFCLLFAGLWWIYKKLIRLDDSTLPRIEGWMRKGGYSLAWLLIAGVLFLPIRGSVTVSTMNTGRVYFSDNQMLNLSAVNPLFNIFESLSENTFNTEKYTYMPTEEAEQLVSELLPDSVPASAHRQLVDSTVNHVVVLILESFSFNAIEAMPELSRIASEGLFFSNAYASSYRTDRGVVSVLSAFPGQPTSSLMTVPAKSKHLPQLGKTLGKAGFNSFFYYGGDEDFTNMRSYLIDGGFQQRICDHDFPAADRMSKWGVPDHLLFARATDSIRSRASAKNKTLDVVLSLSSHEPFEVPATKRFENVYLNSIAYTDSCIGAMYDSLRLMPDWEHTLIVMSADHGFLYPAGITNPDPLHFRIPLVIAGGAVREPQEITAVCSQIDLIPTLLSQMNMPISEYCFSKDVLNEAQKEFAFYSFNDGFALVTPNDTVVIDAVADKTILGSDEHTSRQAHAFMQRIMETIDEMGER